MIDEAPSEQKWLDLAMRVWSRVAIARQTPQHGIEVWPVDLTPTPPSGEGEAIYLHLVMIGRTVFGVRLALQRLLQARMDYDAAFDAGGGSESTEAGFRMSCELHALFVYLDTFWDNLRCLRRALPGIPGLGTAYDSNTQSMRVAKTARDHLEHIDERIVAGRRIAPPMSPEVFRRSAGGFDGRVAIFGDEEFDVIDLHDAAMAAQEIALAALSTRL